MKLKEMLKEKLSEDELKLLPRAYDIIGNIAIFNEFPKELKKKEKLIGETLIKLNKQIKTVAVKSGEVKGKYRTRKIRIIAGKKTKETSLIENNVKLKLNVETCYFSPRLSNERLRIAKEIKNNEDVLVMFSGVAVYPLVIAANSDAKEIYGIEINPDAHKYALENLRLNRFNNIILIKGDVRKVNLNKKFDRIVMPLPKEASTFLDIALRYSKKGTIIHLYDFINKKDNSVEKIKKYVKNFKVLNTIKCGQITPRKFRVCVDFKI